MNPRLLLFFALLVSQGCYENEPIPFAAFSFSGNNGFRIPCTVTFTNSSTDAFSYDWFFGNDSTSSETNPQFTYVKPGKYMVELRSYTESRSEWASLRQEIAISDTVDQ